MKGSRRKIGGFSNKKRQRQFEEHELSFAKGTRLYLSSDGYIDQNNPQRERFGVKKFQQLLQTVQVHPMPQQLEILKG